VLAPTDKFHQDVYWAYQEFITLEEFLAIKSDENSSDGQDSSIQNGSQNCSRPLFSSRNEMQIKHHCWLRSAGILVFTHRPNSKFQKTQSFENLVSLRPHVRSGRHLVCWVP
jgi:hypothetical protein